MCMMCADKELDRFAVFLTEMANNATAQMDLPFYQSVGMDGLDFLTLTDDVCVFVATFSS